MVVYSVFPFIFFHFELFFIFTHKIYWIQVNIGCDLHVSFPVCPTGVVHVLLHMEVTWRSHTILTWTSWNTRVPLFWVLHIYTMDRTGPVSAVGKASWLQIQGSQVQSRPDPILGGDWSWNKYYGHSPPSADSRRVVVSYKQKCVHEVLVNHLVKIAQEKRVVRWTDRLNMTITVDWDVKNKIKQTKQWTILNLTVSNYQTLSVVAPEYHPWHHGFGVFRHSTLHCRSKFDKLCLSHDVVSGSVIMPCIKIEVFSNVM